jgi:predicted NBD/HSP70 family sugar kinase
MDIKQAIIGIDFGGTSIKMGIFSILWKALLRLKRDSVRH